MKGPLVGYLVVVVVALAGVLLFGAAMLMRRLLAPVSQTPARLTTYESGVDPVGQGWSQSQVRYLGFAFLYVVFAVDAVYLFPWATVLRDADLGVASLVEMGIFIGVLVVGLAHAARRGLLRWTP
ncbi:NADH-quinone oxidoreductase subunit A [Barrientosiimonas humi]|uniref:NADH-quinone oxidoreductase subunit n=1 Tax=Barrientosiimonas humi TaxID=999931 RepID=A0A542X8J0_9MICO|nr:NADH-quinone oxidoreductase subunit A [Barrientosiimonas humi]TQL32145.1 NADH-quinone oxidoreductase subunit A [Barrientosiimonas humi]CAG7572133.1 NAD(P)H-quinone oxidoreductase subunit 3 [Barrientosiimonas humi]